jgi:hypothetical protein
MPRAGPAAAGADHRRAACYLFKRLKAAQLENSTEAERRRLAAVKMLIIDDLAGRGFAGLGQNRIQPGTLASGAT